MTRDSTHGRRAVLVLATLISCAGAPATTMAAEDGWQIDATIYAWLAGIDSTTATGGSVDIPFDTIWDDLDMTFMGALEARKGKWGLRGDVVYLKISAQDSATERVPVFGPITIPVTVNADVTMKSRIVTLEGSYRLVDTGRASFSFLGGARNFDLDLELNLDLSAFFGSGSLQISESDNVWDGILGVRGDYRLDDRWYVAYQLDAGAGESELTWQAIGGIGYRLDWCDLLLAYRHLEYDFKSNFPLSDTKISGPALGARFFF